MKNKPQSVMLLNPLSQDEAELARRLAAAPLKPDKPQTACDVGLFSDAAAQLDLVDMVRRTNNATD